MRPFGGADESPSSFLTIPARAVALLLLAICTIEIGVQLLNGANKQFWYDELITYHLDTLPSIHMIIAALHDGADASPPGFHILEHWASFLPANPLLTLRLPALIGYLLTLCGVYWFVRKRFPAIAGLAAVLLLTLSPFRAYAIEARSYALLVGFVALSAACWQRIGERRFMTPLFGLFLVLGVACHYMGVVVLPVFGLAELAWTLVARRIRWGVWAAFLCAAIPEIVCLPILRETRKIYSGNFWAPPSFNNAIITYGDYLGIDYRLAFALVVLIVLAIGSGLFLRRSRRDEPGSRFDEAELVLIAGLTLYPAILAVLTRIMSAGYTPRYGLPGIVGLVLGSVYLSRGVWSKPLGTFAAAALMASFLIQGANDIRVLHRTERNDERWKSMAVFSRKEPGIPIVVGSPTSYLEAVEYTPEDQRGRLVEVADPDIARQIVGADTVDKNNPILARYVPAMRIESRAAFFASNRRFLLQSGGYLDWVTAYVIGNGYRMTLLANYTRQSLYLVER